MPTASLARLDVHLFERLQQLAVLVAVGEHRRARHLELVALAAHVLDQDGQVQLAAPRDVKGVRALGLGHAQGHIVAQLVKQALAQAARRAPAAFQARQRRGVDAKAHAHGGLFDEDHRQRRGDRRDRPASRRWPRRCRPDDHGDLASVHMVHVDALQALVHLQIARALGHDRAVAGDARQLLARAQRAAGDATDGRRAAVLVIVQRGDQHLQRRVGIDHRRGDIAQDGVEQRLQVGPSARASRRPGR